MILILLIIILILLIVLWFWNDHVKHLKCPPGPLRLPLLGNIIQIARISQLPGIAFNELAKKYGDIFYIRLGCANTVIFNTAESIQHFRAHPFCQNRAIQMVPNIVIRTKGKNLGIILSNGNVHNTLRSFTVRTLREFGFGKSSSMDILINEEIEILIDIVKSQFDDRGSAIIDNMDDLLLASIARIINRYTTGTRYDYDDPRIRKLFKLSKDVIQSFNAGISFTIAFPFLFDWFPNLFGKMEQSKVYGKLKDFFREIVVNRRAQSGYKISTNTLLDEFLLKIDQNDETNDTPFTDEQLVMCLLDLFQAGSDTTSNTINFALLYMIIHQNIQKKVQQEMDDILSNGESIGYDTREKLPFTYATLLECTRYFANVPTSIPHLASENFYYKGFLIKKGTYLIGNNYGHHHSETIWGDPHTFRPERFLKADGTVDINKANILMLFGCGSRMCLGMRLAESVLFIYFATLLRYFTLKKVCESDILSTVPTLGSNPAARPYKVKVIPRHQN